MKRTKGLVATEQRNPRSANLDLKSTREILGVINREDARVARAVRREIPKIARAVDQIVMRLRKGGRLFYIGAGTSGRLGVLDASECPPTFGVKRTLVQGIIAGGNRALTVSVERAEDHAGTGAHDLRARALRAGDAVVGIAASGSTPYVIGALKFARKRGAYTIALTTNRATPISRVAHLTIEPATGREVIAGSTRMKSGTAQKMVLNMISTATMARLRYIYDNWMIGVAKSNQKLCRRAVRNLGEATGANEQTAERILKQAAGDLRVALVMLKFGLEAQAARHVLAAHRGDVRKALRDTGQASQRMKRN
ncbi:MAG: N-acetylmuramic acid 6-phosphate etherase [Candidatus Acidiferrales bacterium]